MMNGIGAMFGRLESRLSSSLVLAALLTLAFPDGVRGQAWELEHEQGVGGGPGGKPDKASAIARPKTRGGKEVGVRIVIQGDDNAIIRAAEGVPVSPFADEAARLDDHDAAVTIAQAEAAKLEAANAAEALKALQKQAAAELALTADQPRTLADTRSSPPTALELLQGAPPKPITTTAIAALPVAKPAPRPASQQHARDGADEQTPEPIEQAQFSPNAAAKPKAILPPQVIEQQSFPVILPSPRKPALPKALVQQALLTPNVAAAPKEQLLRTAPAPTNALVERVEPPTDYSLAVEAGTGELLNLGKPITNVFVADPNVADVNVLSPTQIVVHGNKLGRTNIFGIGDGGDVVFAVDVDTVPNADVAQKQLEAASPGTSTKVALRSGALIANGGVASVAEAIDIAHVTDELRRTQGPTVNNTTIEGSQQVNIRVRFAEVSRNDVFNLGVNWDALVDTGDFLFGLSTGNFLSAGSDLLARDLAINGEEFGRVDFTGEFGDVSIDAFIDALQREGIVNILAEPNLTSVNGEPANFLAGGEIPILVPGGGGGDTVTIDYKPFGVSLDFIPTLLPGERINLRVRPEVSSISQAGAVVLDGFSVPAFTVRRAETSVELASGQTFAIAGLFQRDLATDTDKFPVLGDVPVLGQLFRSQRFKRYETELVILITPYLVKPTSNRNIALPNERLDTPAGPLVKKDRKRAGFIVN